jgi:hypothetical protein
VRLEVLRHAAELDQQPASRSRDARVDVRHVALGAAEVALQTPPGLDRMPYASGPTSRDASSFSRSRFRRSLGDLVRLLPRDLAQLEQVLQVALAHDLRSRILRGTAAAA